MLERLGANEEAKDVAEVLAVGAEEQRFARLGPDLDLLSPACCTSERCREKCARGFSEMMGLFHLDATLPLESI